MDELKQMKTQLWLMVAVGLGVTVMAALRQNTILAVLVFVAQGTVGSMLNAKYRNEVMRILEQDHPSVYNDLRMSADLSPNAAAYPAEVAAMLKDCLLVQRVNKWMPIGAVLVFFVIQLVLFGNL